MAGGGLSKLMTLARLLRLMRPRKWPEPLKPPCFRGLPVKIEKHWGDKW